MNIHQLQHVVRAAARVTGVADTVVLDSQAVFGTFRDATVLPVEATRSREADLAVDAATARIDLAVATSDFADQIDGAFGEHSRFDATFGYYPQGVEVHDLWASKAAAGREKDYEFCIALAAAGL